jgi:hypothetical protein
VSLLCWDSFVCRVYLIPLLCRLLLLYIHWTLTVLQDVFRDRRHLPFIPCNPRLHSGPTLSVILLVRHFGFNPRCRCVFILRFVLAPRSLPAAQRLRIPGVVASCSAHLRPSSYRPRSSISFQGYTQEVRVPRVLTAAALCVLRSVTYFS